MSPTPLSKVASWAGGRLLSGSADALVTSVCSDSRSLKAGDLFVALRGENFDAHAFVSEAAIRGAVGAIVEKAPLGLPGSFGIIEVLDTLRALQALSGNYRSTLSARFIGITGSNGKTSTKDFTAAILARRYRTAKSPRRPRIAGRPRHRQQPLGGDPCQRPVKNPRWRPVSSPLMAR